MVALLCCGGCFLLVYVDGGGGGGGAWLRRRDELCSIGSDGKGRGSRLANDSHHGCETIRPFAWRCAPGAPAGRPRLVSCSSGGVCRDSGSSGVAVMCVCVSAERPWDVAAAGRGNVAGVLFGTGERRGGQMKWALAVEKIAEDKAS